MEENKQGENQINYSIPGVIIPEQKTENGQIIKSDATSTTTVVEESQPNLMQAPDLIKPKAVSTEIQTEPVVQQPPLGVVENVQPVVQNAQAAPSTSTDTLQPVSQEVPAVQTPPEVPTLPNMEVPKFEDNMINNDQKPKKQKKVKGPRKPISRGTLIFFIIVLLGIVGYFVYNDYIKPKEKIDPVKELQRERSVDINSLVSQTLYNYVNLDGCDEQINFFYGDVNNVTLKDLSQETKNYLAYRQLKYKDIETKNCTTFPNALNTNDSIKLWYCGDFESKETTTKIFSEDKLRTQVEKMFGEGSYKSTTFQVASSARYLFDSKTSNYIYQSFDGQNNCSGYTNTLYKVARKGNVFRIAVKVKNNANNKLQMFYYTFEETENGNYYFSSLAKKDI